MEPTDKVPEERLGTVATIRQRADTLLGLASACDAEATALVESVARLRARAEGLREQSLEYTHAARTLEEMGRGAP